MIKNTIILITGIAGTEKNTIAEAIKKIEPSFKVSQSHSYYDPILKLLGDDASVWRTLDEKAWNAINQAREVVLNTIADVCPHDSNFVLAYEMLANNPYHHDFYHQVCAVVEKRKATLIPVRLICELDELLKRALDPERAAYFKTRDASLTKKRFAEEPVFHFNHPNELTLDVTDLKPKDAAKRILEHVTQR